MSEQIKIKLLFITLIKSHQLTRLEEIAVGQFCPCPEQAN